MAFTPDHPARRRRYALPFPRPELLGREEAFGQLHGMLRRQSVALVPAVAGLAGTGTSALAQGYAHGFQHAHPGGVYWVPAADPDRITIHLAALAEAMDLPPVASEGDEAEYRRRRARQWVDGAGADPGALLILDGVEAPELLDRPLAGLATVRPGALGCRLLATTRLGDLTGCASLSLALLPTRTARDLLARVSERSAREASGGALDLCDLLGGLPLALCLAGRLLRADPVMRAATLAERLRELGARRPRDPRRPSAEELKANLAATLAECWESLPEDRPGSAEILGALGCLPAGDPVPLGLVACLVSTAAGVDGSFQAVADDIEPLRALGLVECVDTAALTLPSAIHRHTERQHPGAFCPGIAERAARCLRQPERLGRIGGADLLALAGLLPALGRHLEPAGAPARDLDALSRTLEQAAPGLRAGFPPMPQIHCHAGRLGDAALREAAERSLAGQAMPWLRQRWGAGADPARQRVLRGHGDWVNAGALSADGRIALSASEDHSLRLWDTTTGECTAVLRGHRGAVRGCALSADGRTGLSAGEDRSLRIWDTVTGHCRGELTGHGDALRSCAMSADGHIAASASQDCTVRVWDTKSNGCIAVLEGHGAWVWGCALSGDGRRVLSSSDDRTLRVWDTASGECRRVLEGHGGSVLACALSADGGTALSTSDDRTLRVWNTASGECIGVLTGHEEAVRGCALDADGGTALSASDDRTLRLWDTATGTCRGVLQGHGDWVRACALSGDGRLALSASDDHTLGLWDTTSARPHPAPAHHDGPVRGCALGADGAVGLSASDDGTLRVWDTASGECRTVLRGHDGPVWDCTLSADGAIALSACDDGALRLWDTASGRCLDVLARRDAPLWACALSADGSLALCAGEDGALALWDTGSGQRLTVLEGHLGPVRGCALSADGTTALSGGGDRTLRVWDTASGECRTVLQGHGAAIWGCALSAGGDTAVSASDDRTLRVWDTASGRCRGVLEGHTSWPWRCQLTGDGAKGLSVARDMSLRLWDTSSGRCIAGLVLPGLTAAAIGTDARGVLTGDAAGVVSFFQVV